MSGLPLSFLALRLGSSFKRNRYYGAKTQTMPVLARAVSLVGTFCPATS